MEKQLFDKWTAALRSGEYHQGKHMLRKSNDSFCCLGVLCEVMGLKKIHNGYKYGDYYLEGSLTPVRDLSSPPAYEEPSSLPATVLGLDAITKISNYPIDITLMNMNDSGGENNDGAAFVEIADALDKMVEAGELVLT